MATIVSVSSPYGHKIEGGLWSQPSSRFPTQPMLMNKFTQSPTPSYTLHKTINKCNHSTEEANLIVKPFACYIKLLHKRLHKTFTLNTLSCYIKGTINVTRRKPNENRLC